MNPFAQILSSFKLPLLGLPTKTANSTPALPDRPAPADNTFQGILSNTLQGTYSRIGSGAKDIAQSTIQEAGSVGQTALAGVGRVATAVGVPNQFARIFSGANPTNVYPTELQKGRELTAQYTENRNALPSYPAFAVTGMPTQENTPNPKVQAGANIGLGIASLYPGFGAEQKLTTKVLGQLEKNTAKMVSKQYIFDLTNQAGVKQAERDLIRKELENHGNTVNVADFTNKIKSELLPLQRGSSESGGQYESITLPPEQRGPIANYSEHIYNSPIQTSAGTVHFGSAEDSAAPGYFAHSRIEDLPALDKVQPTKTKGGLDMYGPKVDDGSGKWPTGDTRRVIELQSDLFQKGRLEGEIRNPIFDEMSPEDVALMRKNDKFNFKAYDEHQLRKTELAKLEPYRNTWHERVIREEVKQAAKDGKTKLQFPTGETAMKIEGLGEGHVFSLVRGNDLHAGSVNADYLKTGMNIYDGRSEWIITDVLGDGKFKAVQKSWLERRMESQSASKEEALREAESIGRTETFDISGKVDTNNPIYRFYEKTVGRYLQNKYNAHLFTDKQGVKWWQVNVSKGAGKAPVEAFGGVAGVQKDDNGDIKFDPIAAGLGVMGLGFLHRGGIQKFYKVFEELKKASKGKMILNPDQRIGVGPLGKIVRSITKTNAEIGEATRQSLKHMADKPERFPDGLIKNIPNILAEPHAIYLSDKVGTNGEARYLLVRNDKRLGATSVEVSLDNKKATVVTVFPMKSADYLSQFELLWKTDSPVGEVLPSASTLRRAGSRSDFSALTETQTQRANAGILPNARLKSSEVFPTKPRVKDFKTQEEYLKAYDQYAKDSKKTRVREEKTALTSQSLGLQSPRSAALPPQTLPKAASYNSDIQKIANSSLNVEHLLVSPESKALISKTVEEVKPLIEKGVGKVLSNQEAIALANRSSKILTRVIGHEDTLQWEAAMLKARQALAAAADSGTVDEAFIKNLLTIKTQGADIARKLQSLSIGADAIEPTAKQAIIEAVLKVTDNIDEVLKAAEGVDFKDLKQATNFYRQFIKPKAGEWLDLVRYNSMLSSPKTHIINAFSNLLNTTLVALFEKTLTGGLDFLGSAITGKNRQYFAGEGGVYLKNALANIKQATFSFADVMRGNRTYTNLDTRNIPIATKGIKGATVATLSVPMRLLEGMDQFFMALAKGGQEGALAYRASKGVRVGNIESQAEKDALYRLFRQKPLDEVQGPLLDAIDQFTIMIQSLRSSKNPIVSNISKFTVPFIQTPMNIFKQGVEYSPAGLGTIVGAKNKTEQLSKALIGSSIFAGAATLLMSNRLTWGEPVDAAGKAAFRAAKMQAYSVKIGNTWYSYQKLPPVVAFPLAMVAAIHDTQQSKKIDDNTVDLVLSGVAKYGQFLADQSYAKSIGDLLAAAKGGESGITQFIGNYGQQLVPYRALGGWLARLTDPTQRKVDSQASFIDKQVQLLMMNIPGLSEKVPARTDAMGNPILQPNQVANAFSPVNTTTQSPQDATSYQRILDLKQLNARESQVSAQKQADAIALDKQLQTLPKDEANAKVAELKQSDPELYAKLKTVAENRKLNLTRDEQLMRSLGVTNGERARYVNEQIMKLQTKAARNAYLKQLQDKKIVTKQVYAQLKALQ